jgi:alanine dehydrogenase
MISTVKKIQKNDYIILKENNILFKYKFILLFVLIKK